MKENNMETDSYYKSIEEMLRKISNFNLFNFETNFKDELKEFRYKLLKNLSEEYKTYFNIYESLIIAHINEIRKEDAFNVFFAGFKNGTEHDLYLKNKYKIENCKDKPTAKKTSN